MSPLVFILVFTSASLHVTWNALVKTCHDKVAFAWATTTLGALVLVPCIVVDLFVKGPSFSAKVVYLSLISGLFEALYIIFLFKAYEYSDLSVVYPLSRGIAPVVALILAGLVVGDTVTIKGMFMVAVIIAGVMMVSLSSLQEKDSAAGIDLRGILMAFCTGCMIAGYHLVDRKAMTINPGTSSLQYLFFVQLFMALFVSAWALGMKKTDVDGIKTECAANARGVLIVGVSTPVAYLLIIVALSLGNVTYIVAGRNIGIFLSVVVGAVFLRERIKRLRLAGAILIVTGVMLLVLASPGG